MALVSYLLRWMYSIIYSWYFLVSRFLLRNKLIIILGGAERLWWWWWWPTSQDLYVWRNPPINAANKKKCYYYYHSGLVLLLLLLLLHLVHSTSYTTGWQRIHLSHSWTEEACWDTTVMHTFIYHYCWELTKNVSSKTIHAKTYRTCTDTFKIEIDVEYDVYYVLYQCCYKSNERKRDLNPRIRLEGIRGGICFEAEHNWERWFTRASVNSFNSISPSVILQNLSQWSGLSLWSHMFSIPSPTSCQPLFNPAQGGALSMEKK